MKTIARLLLCVAVLASAGCLKVDQTLTLQPDGSGAITLKYAISDQAINQLKAMRKLQSQLAMAAGEEEEQDDEATRFLYLFLMPNEQQWRQELSGYAKHGVTVEQLKMDVRNAWHHVNLKLAFRGVDGLARTEMFRYTGFSLGRNDQGNYTLFRVQPRQELPGGVDLQDAKTQKLLSPLLGGFRVAFKVETPARILETNASTRAPQAAAWVYDYDQNPAAVNMLQSLNMVVVFEGKGLRLPQIKWTPPSG